MFREFRAEKVPRPIPPPGGTLQEWLSLFQPLELEIGCGVGWHPIQRAIRNPDLNLIAIEHTRAKFSQFERRYDRNGRPQNLLPVHANAVNWVTHFLPPQSLNRIFILYPNPEPKNPSKRWFIMPFFETLLSKLKPDGQLIMKTNIETYALEAVKAVESRNDCLISVEVFSKNSHPSLKPETHFEKKYFERGERLHILRLTKV